MDERADRLKLVVNHIEYERFLSYIVYCSKASYFS